MTQVVIDDIIPRTQLVSAAAQTIFNTTWTADAETDILVYARADGVEPDDFTQLVSNVDYNVTFVGGSETVRVTFLVGRTIDDVITIVRDTPADRMNLYINTNFTPSMLNEDFGILTLVDQQAQMFDSLINPGYNVSATIEPNSGLGGGDVILPILPAGHGWRKKEDGTEIETISLPDGGFAPADSTYILQVADSDLINAQAMGALISGLVVNTTATGVQLTRILTGTANEIDVNNGNGISGNPTFSLSATLDTPGTFTINSTIVLDSIIDDDTMATATATNIPTSESVVAYVASTAGGAGGSNTEIQYNNAGALAGDSGFTTDGAGSLTVVGDLSVDNLNLNGNTVISTNVNGNILIIPNGTGFVNIFNETDSALVEVLRLEGDRATPTDNDKAYINLNLSNSAGTQIEFSRISWNAESVIPGAENGSITLSNITAGVLEESVIFGSSEIVINESGLDKNFRVEALGEDNAFLINGANGNAGFGTGAPNIRLEILGLNASLPAASWFTTATFGIGFLDDLTQTASLTAFAGNTAGDRPLNYGRRSRGTLAIPTAVVNADFLYSVIASGFDGTNFQQGATINFQVDNVVSAGVVPTGLIFQTGSNFATRATRISINSAGSIQFGNANAIVTTILDEDTMASNSATALATQQSIKAYVDSKAPTLTDGQLIIGVTGLSPVAATLTAGAGISIAEGAGTITISGVASGMGWNTDATGTIAMAVDTGYICGNAGVTTGTLPAVAAVGSVCALEGLGAGGFVLTAAGGDTIQIGSVATSAGGTLTSAAATDNVYVVCIVANTTWRVQHTNSAGLTPA